MLRRTACCLVLGLLLSACSSPPEKERQQAVAAIEAARTAGAPIYAAAEFRDAQAALAKYEQAVAQRDYRQALNHALEARDLAFTATSLVEPRKAELRSQADRLAAELDALVTRATARLSASPRLPASAASRLRAARDAGRSALQKARTHLADLEYPQATQAVEPAVIRLRRELPAQADAPQKRKK
jgi:hypothetical protein